MPRSFLPYLCLLAFALNCAAQQGQHADLHVHSALKPFSSGEESPWRFFEHTCLPTAYQLALRQADDVPKHTQANFESLLQGNVRLAFVSLSPIEWEMRHPKVFSDLEKQRNTFSCMAGVQPGWEFFLDKEVDYFQELQAQLRWLALSEKVPHRGEKGDTLSFAMVRNATQYDSLLATPGTLAVALSVEGAHAVGKGPVTPELLANEWHQLQMLDRIKWLKGATPDPQTGERWEVPLAVMTLNHFMWNGLSGHAPTFGTVQGLILDQTEGMDEGITPLGWRVIETLLDTTAGTRILVDVKHMGIQSRREYYAHLRQRREAGDNVPVLATHVGIAGCGWALAEKEGKGMCSHEEISLFDEDLQEIFASHGMLGIMLDKHRIGGKAAHAWVDGCHDGSADQRNAYVRLLLLNMLEVVDALHCPEAWDIISIGSDYDGMISAMEPYASAADFPSLRRDLLAFLSKPTDLVDGWPEARVRAAMHGLSAEQIVEKVMGGNLIRFTREMYARHLHLKAPREQEDKP